MADLLRDIESAEPAAGGGEDADSYAWVSDYGTGWRAILALGPPTPPKGVQSPDPFGLRSGPRVQMEGFQDVSVAKS